MDSGFDEGLFTHFPCSTTDMSFSVPQPLIDFTDDAPVSETSAQDYLKPLSETVDRVSKQVEEFASRLHRYKADRDTDDQALWDDALGLLDGFEGLTRKRIDDTESDRPQAFSHRQSLGDTDVLLGKLELEADLWQLTRRLLANESPSNMSQSSEAQDSQMKYLNRYSTNSELWNAFMDSDPVAQQYEATLDWLQMRATTTSPSIDTIVRELTLKSERGEGVWSAGPIFTRNAVKKQKRLRSWPSPLTPNDGGLGKIHKRQTDGQPLVAQLDPDAATREDAVLELQDECYEQAAWVTCWELLRRGLPVSEIRSWWDDRGEQWRAVLFNATYPGSENGVVSPWLRMMNSASNPYWMASCRSLAENSAIVDPYQKAVYAILAGETRSSRMICDTIDDYMFIEFNSLLIQRFEAYLHAFRNSVDRASKYVPPPRDQERIQSSIRALQQDPNLHPELQDPYKSIEIALISQKPGPLFVFLGRAAAQVAHRPDGNGFKNLIRADRGPPVSPTFLLAARDQDCVRVIVHLQLILSSLGSLRSTQLLNEEQLENNIINYIGWLQMEKKWSLLPVYASRLSKLKTKDVLGEILIDVTNEKERSSQVRLMKRYDIDVSDVIQGLVLLAESAEIQKYQNKKFPLTAPRITEREEPDNSVQTRIKTDFMGGEDYDITGYHERLCKAVEWYQYVTPDYWGWACTHVTLLYQCWLLEGNFGALKMLAKSASLSMLSLAVCKINLNFAEEIEGEPQGESGEGSQAAQNAATRAEFYKQSMNWRDLELLVLALEQLERWQMYADQCAE